MLDDVLVLRNKLLATAGKAWARNRRKPLSVIVCRLVAGMERRDPENADLYRRAGLQAVMFLRKGTGDARACKKGHKKGASATGIGHGGTPRKAAP